MYLLRGSLFNELIRHFLHDLSDTSSDLRRRLDIFSMTFLTRVVTSGGDWIFSP